MPCLLDQLSWFVFQSTSVFALQPWKNWKIKNATMLLSSLPLCEWLIVGTNCSSSCAPCLPTKPVLFSRTILVKHVTHTWAPSLLSFDFSVYSFSLAFFWNLISFLTDIPRRSQTPSISWFSITLPLFDSLDVMGEVKEQHFWTPQLNLSWFSGSPSAVYQCESSTSVWRGITITQSQLHLSWFRVNFVINWKLMSWSEGEWSEKLTKITAEWLFFFKMIC